MTTQPPMPEETLVPLVVDHLPALAAVLTSAWAQYEALRDGEVKGMAEASASSRGMLVSDFTLLPAHALFRGVEGARVDTRFRRPWVVLAEGSVRVRFRKLDSALRLCRSDSGRATALAYHLTDPVLPVESPAATILTAGYVLDEAEQGIAWMALCCHVGWSPYYSIPLPGGSAAAPGPTTLPLVPLSDPVIRSARDVAAKRVRGQGSA